VTLPPLRVTRPQQFQPFELESLLDRPRDLPSARRRQPGERNRCAMGYARIESA
jgi:hypothetical protein